MSSCSTLETAFEWCPIVESQLPWIRRTIRPIGSGRRASVGRTLLGRRDDELANAAEAAAVADSIGLQASPGDHTNAERDRSWDGHLADPRTGPPADEFG